MKEITLLATIENIEKVIDFVNLELEEMSCPTDIKMTIDVAVDEIFANIANYAYKPNVGEAKVIVENSDNPKSITISFVDNGIPYNPLIRKEPDVKLSINEREIGGLGIFIVKKSMDNVEYEYKNNQNILRIKKFIWGGVTYDYKC